MKVEAEGLDGTTRRWIILGATALALGGLAWAGLSAAYPAHTSTSTSGDRQDFTLRADTPTTRTFAWDFAATLTPGSGPFAVFPRLPYDVAPDPGVAPGPDIEFRILINGAEAYRRLAGNTAGGAVGSNVGVPNPDEVDQGALRPGQNAIRYEVKVHVSGEGEGLIRVGLGPLLVDVTEADADRDGVKDSAQPVRAIPTGIVTFGAAAAAAAGVEAVFRVRKR